MGAKGMDVLVGRLVALPDVGEDGVWRVGIGVGEVHDPKRAGVEETHCCG